MIIVIIFVLVESNKFKHISINGIEQFQDDTRSNPHLQRLARLEFEKIQREAQSEERKKRESEKDELDGRIRQKKEQLAKLKPQLQNILAVSDFLKMKNIVTFLQQFSKFVSVLRSSSCPIFSQKIHFRAQNRFKNIWRCRWMRNGISCSWPSTCRIRSLSFSQRLELTQKFTVNPLLTFVIA